MSDSASLEAAEPRPEETLSWAQRALHIFILCGFAVAQPVLDMAGRHAQFFVAHGSRPWDLVALTVILCFLVPLLVFLAELIPGLFAERAGRSMHSVLVALLSTTAVLPFLRLIDGVSGWLWLPVALILGISAAAVYDRSARVRSNFTWFWPAPLMFGAIFLFLTPVRNLLLPEPYVSPVDIEVAAETPVVIVVFDELSLPTLMDESYRIDADRFPNFATLSRRSHWFRNATTTAEFTPIAIPALLSGRYRGTDTGDAFVATAERHPQTLFALLAPEYRLHVVEPLTNICPRELCGPTLFDDRPMNRLSYLLSDLSVIYPHALLPQDVANELPDISNQWRGFKNVGRIRRDKAFHMEAGRTPGTFAKFLSRIRSGERKALYFLHSMLPHVPWRYTPSGKDYEAPEGGLVSIPGLHHDIWTADEFTVQQAFQRYLFQVQFTDRLLGDLIATLEAAELWDETLLVITADHGISFQTGEPRRVFKPSTLTDVLSVPLFIKLPHQDEGTISDRNVELIDVLPTITEALGLPAAPWPMDGESLFGGPTSERQQKTVFVRPYKDDSFRTFEPAELTARYPAVDRMLALFGRSGDPLDLYRIGPHSELVERSLAELRVAAEAEGQLVLKRPDLYENVDPESNFLPVRVIGEIRNHGRGRGALNLAIAVEGTVWATTRTYFNHRDRAYFAAMVPDHALVSGRNTVQVFILSEDDGLPLLSPIPTDEPPSGWLNR